MAVLGSRSVGKLLVVEAWSLGCEDGGVVTGAGKSSLTVQLVDGHFVDSYYPTIENTFSKVIKHKGQDFAMEIVDTAGTVSFRPIVPCQLPSADFPTRLPALIDRQTDLSCHLSRTNTAYSPPDTLLASMAICSSILLHRGNPSNKSRL